MGTLSSPASAYMRRSSGPSAATWNFSSQAGELNVDRKSTRLNSSHVVISYAVFCLKKKKTYHSTHIGTAPLSFHGRLQLPSAPHSPTLASVAHSTPSNPCPPALRSTATRSHCYALL